MTLCVVVMSSFSPSAARFRFLVKPLRPLLCRRGGLIGSLQAWDGGAIDLGHLEDDLDFPIAPLALPTHTSTSVSYHARHLTEVTENEGNDKSSSGRGVKMTI
jgi:hypothetical protein